MGTFKDTKIGIEQIYKKTESRYRQDFGTFFSSAKLHPSTLKRQASVSKFLQHLADLYGQDGVVTLLMACNGILGRILGQIQQNLTFYYSKRIQSV